MDKPRLRQIIDPIERKLIDACWQIGNIDLPSLLDFPDGTLWADADELRLWRATLLQTGSRNDTARKALALRGRSSNYRDPSLLLCWAEMSDVDLKSAIARLHTQADLHGLEIGYEERPTSKEPWFMYSASFHNIYAKEEIWMRLPEWLSRLVVKWLKRKSADTDVKP